MRTKNLCSEHNGPENLKKSRQKKTRQIEIMQFHGISFWICAIF